jgi:hypothetical protein
MFEKVPCRQQENARATDAPPAAKNAGLSYFILMSIL